MNTRTEEIEELMKKSPLWDWMYEDLEPYNGDGRYDMWKAEIEKLIALGIEKYKLSL